MSEPRSSYEYYT